jgi:hypothetical protein
MVNSKQSLEDTFLKSSWNYKRRKNFVREAKPKSPIFEGDVSTRPAASSLQHALAILAYKSLCSSGRRWRMQGDWILNVCVCVYPISQTFRREWCCVSVRSGDANECERTRRWRGSCLLRDRVCARCCVHCGEWQDGPADWQLFNSQHSNIQTWFWMILPCNTCWKPRTKNCKFYSKLNFKISHFLHSTN